MPRWKRRGIEPPPQECPVVTLRLIEQHGAMPEVEVGPEERHQHIGDKLQHRVAFGTVAAIAAGVGGLPERVRIPRADKGAVEAEAVVADVAATDMPLLAEGARVHGDAMIVVKTDMGADAPIGFDGNRQTL